MLLSSFILLSPQVFIAYLFLSPVLQSISLSSSFVYLSPFVLSPLPLSPSIGGSGGDPAWRGEGSDVQGVLAVGVRSQSSDAAGSPVRPP